MGHDQAHHDHRGPIELDHTVLQVRALKTVLTQLGYTDLAVLEAWIGTCQTRIGPCKGARVQAKAWSDAGYRQWLQRDARAAVESLG